LPTRPLDWRISGVKRYNRADGKPRARYRRGSSVVSLSLLLLSSPQVPFAIAARPETYQDDPRVYYLETYGRGDGKVGFGTAFLWEVDGKQGLVTALHVVIDGSIWFAKDKSNAKVRLDLAMVGVESDVAFLTPSSGNLPIDVPPYRKGPLPEAGDPLTVSGFPSASTLETEDKFEVARDWHPGVVKHLREVPNERSILYDLLNRRMMLDSRVIWITGQSNISPGHSGGPVLNRAGQIVAVATGVHGEPSAGRAWVTRVDSLNWRTKADVENKMKILRGLPVEYQLKVGTKDETDRKEYPGIPRADPVSYGITIGSSRLQHHNRWSDEDLALSVMGGLRLQLSTRGPFRTLQLICALDHRKASGTISTMNGVATQERYEVAARQVQGQAVFMFQPIPKTGGRFCSVISVGGYAAVVKGGSIRIRGGSISDNPDFRPATEFGGILGWYVFPWGLGSGWSVGPRFRLGSGIAERPLDPRGSVVEGSFGDVSVVVGRSLF